MTDTPQVPSEATTGTLPAPETLASPDTAAVAVTVPVPEEEAPADAPLAASSSAPEEPLAPAAEEAPAESTGDTPAVRSELAPAACAALLAEHFPALFGAAPRPLKLRIQADIQARAPGIFTRKSLSTFLHRYTTSNAYLNALVKAPQRVDLDGADAGEIADEHRIAATEELARRRAVHETRRREARAAENAARRAGPRAEAPAAEGDAQQTPAPEGQTATPAVAADGPRPGRPAQAPRRPSGPGDRQGQAPGREPGREARDTRGPRPGGQRPEQRGQPRPDARSPRGDSGEHGRPRRPAQGDQRAGPDRVQADGRPGQHLQENSAAQPQQHAQHHTEQRHEQPQPVWSEAERERAALLRAYEGSTLTRANFCVLKRIDEGTLEAQLLLARQERAQRPAAPPRPEFREQARSDFRPGPRRPRSSTPGRA